jgi:hypothetical protein
VNDDDWLCGSIAALGAGTEVSHMDVEQLLEDIIIDLDGYYPHQLAQKIIEALDCAGFHIAPNPVDQ